MRHTKQNNVRAKDRQWSRREKLSLLLLVIQSHQAIKQVHLMWELFHPQKSFSFFFSFTKAKQSIYLRTANIWKMRFRKVNEWTEWTFFLDRGCLKMLCLNIFSASVSFYCWYRPPCLRALCFFRVFKATICARASKLNRTQKVI